MALTEQQQRALKQIAEASVAAERETGCPAELSAAQAILESAWLTRAPGNNCFGIKDTDRQPGCQYCVTKEFVDGSWKTQKLAFEVFPSLGACFSDHARLLAGGFGLPSRPNCYYPAWQQYLKDRNLDQFIARIAQKYATDPNYAATVIKLAHGASVTAAIAAAREAA